MDSIAKPKCWKRAAGSHGDGPTSTCLFQSMRRACVLRPIAAAPRPAGRHIPSTKHASCQMLAPSLSRYPVCPSRETKQPSCPVRVLRCHCVTANAYQLNLAGCCTRSCFVRLAVILPLNFAVALFCLDKTSAEVYLLLPPFSAASTVSYQSFWPIG